jgi:ATP/maltotriose-dependent transcriptional regulator MalT/DNA-binding SARP family transcriptional activator
MRTQAAKVLAPTTPTTYVGRPSVLAALEAGSQRRLTVVVAGPGYGKSTLVAAWASARRATWYTIDASDRDLPTFVAGLVSALRTRLPSLPAGLDRAAGTLALDGDEIEHADAVVDRLAQVLERMRQRPLTLVIDDLHALAAGSASARVVEGLCRQGPRWLRLVVCSREEPPFPISRLRGQGDVLDIDAAALTFDVEDTEQLLAAVLGDDAARHARSVQAFTGGWPVVVRLAAEALAAVAPSRRAEALEKLPLPGGRLLDYLAEEVIASRGPEITQLVRALAPFPRFSIGLCEAVGVPTGEDTLADLARRGLFVEPRSTVDGWFSLHGLVREYALRHMPLDPAETREHCGRAAGWLTANGHLADALQALAGTGDDAAVGRFLAEHGWALMEQGSSAALLAAAEALPDALGAGTLAEVVGAAHHARGEWDEALSAFLRATGTDGPLRAGTAWRMGLVYHMRGELDRALETYRRGRREPAGPDTALLLAWASSAHWLRGEVDDARELAAEAIARAEGCHDHRALAAAHTALALLAATDGRRDANDAHYLRALDEAERGGDTLQLTRIRANRGSRFLEEGAYEEALTELDLAVEAGELTGFLGLLGLAQSNRAEVHLRQGRLDEAQVDYEAAVRTFQRAGSRLVRLALAGLGDTYRERGQLVRAGAAYREALALAEADGDVQALVAALAGLARATVADEPEQAAKHAARAVEHGTGLSEVKARLAAGWVALARADEAAAVHAGEAVARAASQRDRPGLAEALVLSAIVGAEPGAAERTLDEAAALWEEVASPLGAARTRLVRARLLGGRHADAEAALAEAQLRRIGVPPWGELAEIPATLRTQDPPPVAIRSLGGFRVLRAGHAVPLADWGSRKARDLLKMLVARRGRPVPREAMWDVLWPDAGDRDLGARLSVLLSTVRGVLDPGRAFPADHFVRADRTSVSLALEHLEVDVEEFLVTSTEALALHESGQSERAQALLAAADDRYRGDFLEEEPYADWAVALREEARAKAIAIARARAREAAAGDERDSAISALLRVLSHDPYDEGAHLALVRTLAGGARYGEAHRRYRLYVERMAELGVEAAPFPAPDTDLQPI